MRFRILPLVAALALAGPLPLAAQGEADGASAPLQGLFRYLADAATFEMCGSGESYPVAMEADYIEAERAYTDHGAQGAPLLVVLEGRVAERPSMEGPDQPHLVIDRFIRLAVDDTCERAMADASLTDTYWRILQIAGEAPPRLDDRREAHLIFRGGDAPGFNATVGCNMMRGGVTLAGDQLNFGQAAMTLMACPPPLDAAERTLGQALADTARWQVVGTTLELFDAGGGVLILAEAVALQ